MATSERHAGENSPISEAEKVLRDYEETKKDKQQTRESAITSGEIERHLRVLQELIDKKTTRRNKAKYGWHASWIKSLCAEYWRQRGQRE